MKLDLSNLEKAILSFEKAMNLALSDAIKNSNDENLITTIRAGVIQNFEFTYELCWKFIQRWLKENYSKEESQLPRTRKELFRMANRAGLINDALPWFEFAEARNLTSHIYNNDTAEDVFRQSIKFLPEAKTLLKMLASNND
ncbi:MAG: nucleotidyltransferase substrate binding protein [Pseudomonadota bacterium]